VGMVIDLAHTFGMEVVAEGVESWARADLLREMGRDMAQGFCLSEPMPTEKVPALLWSDPHARAGVLLIPPIVFIPSRRFWG
jgi:EAL domain-containing protein (putative c-di-GMP-specific phosphodiesterase class I)